VIVRFVTINVNACAEFKNGRHCPLKKKKKQQTKGKESKEKQ